MCCNGWPVRGLNDFTELWLSENSNWSYDGDQDLTTYPGYLAVAAPATGTFVDFTPLAGSFSPYPRVPTGPFPYCVWIKMRSLCVAGSNRSMMVIDINSDSSYIEVIFHYVESSGNYFLELITESSDEDFDTGIPLSASADRLDDLLIVISPVSVTLYLNGVLIAFKSGLNFPSITLTEITAQRAAANIQGMVGRTEIYTQAP